VSYVAISLPRLAVAFAFIALAAAIARVAAPGLGRALFAGAARAAVQLTAVGWVLVLLFAKQSAPLVLGLLSVMLLVATATSARRIEHGPPARVVAPWAFVAILGGAAAALVPFFAFIVRPHPWFDARYVVPLAGMMVSNAMNVVAQVFERVFASARAERATVEMWLALGASPARALESQTRAAVRAALIPTLNGLLTVGLVALPGMMTGQILSGIEPDQAVRYQLVVMYQLVAVAAVSGGLGARFARRLLFTPREQLRGVE
jgi:putative ABC transport system permease protein